MEYLIIYFYVAKTTVRRNGLVCLVIIYFYYFLQRNLNTARPKIGQQILLLINYHPTAKPASKLYCC